MSLSCIEAQQMQETSPMMHYMSPDTKETVSTTTEVYRRRQKRSMSRRKSTLGHSLGSLIASDVGKNSKEIINYNKPLDPKGKANSNEYNKKTTRDPFSFFVPRKKNTIQIQSKTMNPLAEHSTDRLDDLS